ncbi:MAG: transcriptional regulator GcvA [Alphaproteobacteria bacterium]|jgi:LysR family transcriptional regulator, glycine cleavage system transcriptional activator|nr:transcriptional regulator GcvA [Alphaproteobacteria bacterium]MBT4082511.1 transcriptional regulator GcvA [Alphaproteobacteria bacterium]MBT4543499.1 transcriptional regulator GcvA [Alphaproteobacteria bacterium]MBT6385543.1 transcriptional regulator GcvA [Alphaproteobacteria bacterium]MBT7745607.1 transcriptional regulator GcvA [Alphaproteobacteria bacterium]
MARRLPPLNALRAFEAAARHLSFTKAADELFVTQAAISHQVKALEAWLGQPLFLRKNRNLYLTEAGQSYAGPLGMAFDEIDTATARLNALDSSGTLTVSVLPSIAAKWLVPRMRGFREQYPDIDVRLSPSTHLTDFSREAVDVVLRYGRGDWFGMKSDLFLTEDIFPVCSPELLKGRYPLNEPADLRHHTLLHDDYFEDWTRWLLAAGVEGVESERGPVYEDSANILQAAIAGEGVALGRSALAADDLAAGRLVRVFNISLPREFAYYVVAPEASADRPKVAAFRHWVIETAANDRLRN